MDTRTGQIVDLDELEARQAEMEWLAYETGLLKKKPRFMHVNGDKTSLQPKRRRKRTKARRSYKDFCNG